MSIARVLVTTFFAWLIASHSFAAVVDVDFDTAPLACCTQTLYVEDGFRISPSAHYDLMPSSTLLAGYSGTNWMAWDGCCQANPNYIGPALPAPFGPTIYIDHFGDPFNFRSFFPIRGSSPPTVLSSKGGTFTPHPDQLGEIVDLTGPEWTQIEWLIFERSDDGAPDVGIDHLTFVVPGLPEPSTLALILIVFSVVCATGWHSSRDKAAPIVG